MRRCLSGGAGVQSPRRGLLKLADHGGRQRASADRAADRTGWRGRVNVILPPQDSTLCSAGAIDSLGAGSVGDLRFGFGHPVEVDIVVGKRTSGGLELCRLGKAELQVNGHLKMQE